MKPIGLNHFTCPVTTIVTTEKEKSPNFVTEINTQDDSIASEYNS
jgi:hypothetical protein